MTELDIPITESETGREISAMDEFFRPAEGKGIGHLLEDYLRAKPEDQTVDGETYNHLQTIFGFLKIHLRESAYDDNQALTLEERVDVQLIREAFDRFYEEINLVLAEANRPTKTSLLGRLALKKKPLPAPYSQSVPPLDEKFWDTTFLVGFAAEQSRERNQNFPEKALLGDYILDLLYTAPWSTFNAVIGISKAPGLKTPTDEKN